MSKQIGVILGSVRTGRAGKAIADWVMKNAQNCDENLTFRLIDLQEINLPFLDEPVPAMMSSEYVHEHTIKWSKIVNEIDGFIIVTPEYNHGYPPVLKNALDFLYSEWQGKSAALIGYGGGPAKDCIRQLSEVLTALGLNVLDKNISISKVWEALDDDGNMKPENIQGNILDIINQFK